MRPRIRTGGEEPSRRRPESVRLVVARGVARGSSVLTVALGSSALVVAGVATVLSQTGF